MEEVGWPLITIIRDGKRYSINGERYVLTCHRLVVDGRDVPLPWFLPARRAPAIVGVVLAVGLRMAA